MRLIDADREIAELDKMMPNLPDPGDRMAVRFAKGILEAAPIIDTELVRHGRWVKEPLYLPHCSACMQCDNPNAMSCYYYMKSKSVDDCRKEADKCWEIASPYNPVIYFCDVEEGCITTAGISAWIDQIRKRGAKKVGIYIGGAYYTKHKSVIPLANVVWYPRYGKNDGTANPEYKPPYPCDIWQYTSVGQVPGIKDKTLDLNILMGDKPLSYYLQH